MAEANKKEAGTTGKAQGAKADTGAAVVQETAVAKDQSLQVSGATASDEATQSTTGVEADTGATATVALGTGLETSAADVVLVGVGDVGMPRTMFGELAAAIQAAQDAGDNAGFAVLHNIEVQLSELRMRLPATHDDLCDEAAEFVSKLKDFLT